MSRALLLERAVAVIADDREAAGRPAPHLRQFQRQPAYVFVRRRFGVRELVEQVGRLGWGGARVAP